MCSSPRASAGLSMFPADIAPSAPPAPTTVCSSSMNMISSSLCVADLVDDLLQAFLEVPAVPASRRPARRGPARRRAVAQRAGTSPSTIRCAMPSTIAVLPTPGSPIRTGLFFVRRDSTSIVCSISSSRPITGSSGLPGQRGQVSAELVQGVLVAGGRPAPGPGAAAAAVTACCSAPGSRAARPAGASAACDSGLTASANSTCSGPMYVVPIARETCCASSSARLADGVRSGGPSRSRFLPRVSMASRAIVVRVRPCRGQQPANWCPAGTRPTAGGRCPGPDRRLPQPDRGVRQEFLGLLGHQLSDVHAAPGPGPAAEVAAEHVVEGLPPKPPGPVGRIRHGLPPRTDRTLRTA